MGETVTSLSSGNFLVVNLVIIFSLWPCIQFSPENTFSSSPKAPAHTKGEADKSRQADGVEDRC